MNDFVIFQSTENEPVSDQSPAKEALTVNLESTVQIFVRNLAADAKRTYTISIPLKASVQTLKETVQEKSGISSEIQRLTYSGKQLQDDQMLWDYGIQKHSTIDLLRATQLILNSVQIFIRHSMSKIGGTYTIEIPLSAPVQELKEKVEQRSGLPPEAQLLTFCGKPLTKDHLKLWEFGIQRLSTIEMH